MIKFIEEICCSYYKYSLNTEEPLFPCINSHMEAKVINTKTYNIQNIESHNLIAGSIVYLEPIDRIVVIKEIIPSCGGDCKFICIFRTFVKCQESNLPEVIREMFYYRKQIRSRIFSRIHEIENNFISKLINRKELKKLKEEAEEIGEE